MTLCIDFHKVAHQLFDNLVQISISGKTLWLIVFRHIGAKADAHSYVLGALSQFICIVETVNKAKHTFQVKGKYFRCSGMVRPPSEQLKDGIPTCFQNFETESSNRTWRTCSCL